MAKWLTGHACVSFLYASFLSHSYFSYFYWHYKEKDSKLKTAYRVYQHLTDDEFSLLKDLNSRRDIKVDDPWSINKLQATTFLNSDKDIRIEALEVNAAGSIKSEVEMNNFCAGRMVNRLLDDILEMKNIDRGLITGDVMQGVCTSMFHIVLLTCYS
jgi:hypothetical protein